MDVAWVALPAVVAVVLRRALRDAFDAPALRRTNYAGRPVATAGGVVAVAAYLVTVAAWTLLDDSSPWLVSSVIAVCGFAVIGLFDDLVGTELARGWRGHVQALRTGQLTSGAVKLLVGAAVALVAVAPLNLATPEHVLAAVVVAGSANAANLFDLRPARLAKVAVPIAVVLAIAAGSLGAVLGPLMFVAAVVALAPAELREALMLGDTGANPLGAAVGLLAVAAADADRLGLAVAAAVVVAVNVAGEFVSFTRVIERVAPLRALDRLGRRR